MGHQWAKTLKHTPTRAGHIGRNVLVNRTPEHVPTPPGQAQRYWQCGGHVRAVVAAAVSWWNGYWRAGGDRLFTDNDREPTGIVRFLSGFEIINPVVAQ